VGISISSNESNILANTNGVVPQNCHLDRACETEEVQMNG
jgi:hypothetical protein